MKLKTKGHITAKMPLLPPNIPFIGVQRSQAQTQRWAKTLKFPLKIPYSILMIDETEKPRAHNGTAKIPLTLLKMFSLVLQILCSNPKMGKDSKIYPLPLS